MDALKQIVTDCTKAELPKIEIGDTVKVHVWIKEGEKKRVQVFEGTVIAKKHGGISETFTPRGPRLRRREGFPHPFPQHRQGGAGQERTRPPQQALLPA